MVQGKEKHAMKSSCGRALSVEARQQTTINIGEKYIQIQSRQTANYSSYQKIYLRVPTVHQ